MRVVHIFGSIVLLAAVCLSAGVQARQDRLPPAVLEALHRAEVPADALTGLAVPLGGGRLPGQRWERHADRPVQPGSTIKLLTSAVALDLLGPNHRGRTELVTVAPVDGDVLMGDLILKGGADADFGVPQLWSMLNELRDSGVRVIAGHVLLDRSLFQPERRDLHVEAFDEGPQFPYNVIPDALNLNGSLLELEIRSDLPNEPGVLRVRSFPRLLGVELRSALTLTEGPCSSWRKDWEGAQTSDVDGVLLVTLHGRFPRGCTIRTHLQVLDRDDLARALIRTLWQQLGGQLDGTVRPGIAPPEARVLSRHLARPWGELLRPLNKQSDNALTRLLYLQLGAASTPPTPNETHTSASAAATTDAKAEQAVRRWLTDRGLSDAGVVLDNGSGLSRHERLSARVLVGALQQALAGPHASDLMMSLPAVGVDGTMRNRLKDSPAAGWTRLKTGTLRNVVALAGVVHDGRRQPWVVVLNINHENAGRARLALDALVDWLARGRP
jgi:serine-type D-Ala-D-Ala carboxypeptidase/endopeptidase (penicillin-binding protein 4)